MIDQLPTAAGSSVLTLAITAALAFLTRDKWRANQRQDVAAADAGTDVIQTLRDEVQRLAKRVKELEDEARLERRHSRRVDLYLWQLETYARQLQGMLRQAGLDVPLPPAPPPPVADEAAA